MALLNWYDSSNKRPCDNAEVSSKQNSFYISKMMRVIDIIEKKFCPIDYLKRCQECVYQTRT